MTFLHVESGEREWASWSEAGGYELHASMAEAIMHVAEEARRSEGHCVIISGDAEVLELGGALREAAGAEICAPFDPDTERRAAKVVSAGSRRDVIIATDASVRRRGGRSTIASAAFDGHGVTVCAHRVPQIGVHAAEVVGILTCTRSVLSAAADRLVVCDAKGAVGVVREMAEMEDREIAATCERLFGSWAYSAFGKQVFDGARRTAEGLREGTLEVRWVRGHDDEAEGAEHDLNVIADQTARALSALRVGDEEVARAQTRTVAEALVEARFPKSSFVAGSGLR